MLTRALYCGVCVDLSMRVLDCVESNLLFFLLLNGDYHPCTVGRF